MRPLGGFDHTYNYTVRDASLGYHGPVWDNMDHCGIIWTIVGEYGPLWDDMDHCGIIWIIVE